jgi:hypothetical protein
MIAVDITMPVLRIPALLLVLAFVSAGCASTPRPDSPVAVLSLLRPLEISPGEASVRLQYGRTVARNGLQETDPHCIFEVNTVLETSREIQPGAFRILRASRRETGFSGMPIPFWHRYGQGLFRHDGPSHIYYLTEFQLQSDGQPDIRSLTCLHNQASASIPRHLSLAEMRQALGSYFSLDFRRPEPLHR